MRAPSRMKAGALCTRNVITIHQNESLIAAARRMRDAHVGSLVVIAEEGERRVPLGILTDRDIVVGVVAVDPTHLDRLDVGDVLRDTNQPYSAQETDDILDVLEKMDKQGLRRMVILDGRGGLVGVLTLDDILRVVRRTLDHVGNIVSSQQAREWQRRP